MRIAALVIAAAAACGPAPLAPAPAAPAPVANTARGPLRDLPDGWVRVAVDADRLYCTRWGTPWWQASLARDGVQLTEQVVFEADTGPAPPFAVPDFHQPRGRRHVAPVRDGFLVGFDAGEWGGSLHWYSRDGAKHRRLTDRNVRGLVALGPDEVVLLEGLNHIVTREGTASWLERRSGWRAAATRPLDAGPMTFAVDRDTLYVATLSSVYRIGRDRRATVVHSLGDDFPYSHSMIVDELGRLWLGMRQVVLRLTPAGDRYTVEWLARRGCERAVHNDAKCDCAPG